MLQLQMKSRIFVILFVLILMISAVGAVPQQMNPNNFPGSSMQMGSQFANPIPSYPSPQFMNPVPSFPMSPPIQPPLSGYGNLEVCDGIDNNGDGIIDTETDPNDACIPLYIDLRLEAYEQMVNEISSNQDSLKQAYLLVDPRKSLISQEFMFYLINNGYLTGSEVFTKSPLEDVLYFTSNGNGFLMVTFSGELLGYLNPNLDNEYRAKVLLKDEVDVVGLFGLTNVVGDVCSGGITQSTSIKMMESFDTSFGMMDRLNIYNQWTNSILNEETMIFSLTSYAKTVLEDGEFKVYLDMNNILPLVVTGNDYMIKRVGSFYDDNMAYIVFNLDNTVVSNLGYNWQGSGFNFWILPTTNPDMNLACEASGYDTITNKAADLFCSIANA